MNSEDEFQNINSSDLKSRNSQNYDSEVFSTENFDFFGQEHNNALNYALTQIFDDDHLTYEDIENNTNYYFSNIYEPTSNFNDELNGISYKDAFEEHINNPETSLANLFKLKNGYAYPQIESHLSTLDEILNSSETYEKKMELILNMDSNIGNSENLLDEDKTYLLLTTSIARNSIEYWNTSLSDGWRDLIDIQVINQPENPAQTQGIDWDKVAVADIAGFIRNFGRGAVTGAVRGAIIGALSSGGTGAIPGAIIGALGWGAASGAQRAAAASGAVAVASWIWD
ncbi:glycine zipper family protein [Chryseobacterium sp.]|uniref:glycine zipper family protein n=1 Tax=Chryseobacterium sp. TaxID=1871047 RepID=UPI0011CC485C|nr:glycine zipper family protein [Chryseobacterium sp.]TXF79548.1 glycine zipper family protein [Chryseobacterium sp.]